MLVQGGPMPVKFAEDALIPYLERKVKSERQAIKEVNTAALKIRFACEVCNMTFETKVKLKAHFTGHMKANSAPTKRRSWQGGSMASYLIFYVCFYTFIST